KGQGDLVQGPTAGEVHADTGHLHHRAGGTPAGRGPGRGRGCPGALSAPTGPDLAQRHGSCLPGCGGGRPGLELHAQPGALRDLLALGGRAERIDDGTAERVEVLADRGQRGKEVRRAWDVVETHDGDVLR